MQLYYRQERMFIFTLLLLCFSCNALNDRPIIGIISQEITSTLDALLPENHNYTSYIAASYVKWVESAGARALPIIVNTVETTDQDLQYFTKLFSGISGVLIPGGAASIYNSGYSRASNIFFDLAMEENLNGNVFPIWATCLGFEMMVLMAVKGQSNLKRCNSYDQALPLEMTEEAADSSLFGQAPSDVLDFVTTLPVTTNFHHWCLTPENFTKYDMSSYWKLLSLNTDEEGTEFVSSLEAKDFPFYATQFHPEKNMFEWAERYSGITHSREATLVNSYMAQFFVDQARQSSHAFSSRAEEEEYLFYNYQTFYSGKEGLDYGFQQVYLF